MQSANKNKIKIGSRLVGKGEPCFIIAETGINHNGDIDIAKKMIDLAVDSCVDAVKFQTFTAEEFVNNGNTVYEYETQGEKKTESMLKMFQRCEFSKDEWREIASYCQEKNIMFFSTPQNISDLNLLLEIGVPAVKVGSDDLINLPLLDEYSRKGLPMIISTGMAYLSEIKDAVKAIKKNNKELIILHCVSSYPTAWADLNLRKILTLQKEFKECVIGFSDHSEGAEAALIAIALGAKVFEKHFTIDKNMPGPDHRFSVGPEELEEIVASIRKTEKALGTPVVKPTDNEIKMRILSYRSIVAAQDIKKGEKITKDDIAAKKPGTGLLAKFEKQVIGKKAKQDIKKGEFIIKEKLTN